MCPFLNPIAELKADYYMVKYNVKYQWKSIKIHPFQDKQVYSE